MLELVIKISSVLKKSYYKLYQEVKPHLTMASLFVNLLTISSTIAISALSYAGAIALGFNFAAGLGVFFLTAVVCLQVNLEMIENALSKLKSFFSSDNKILNSIMLLMSLLAAISFSFSTLNAAFGLFSITASVIISVSSSLAFFFISYELMQKAYDYLKHYEEHALKFYNNLKTKKWYIKLLAPLACIALLTMTGYLMVATANTWWLETQLGALLLLTARSATVIKIITAPFAIISNSLFAAINSVEAVLKLSDFGITSIFSKNRSSYNDISKQKYKPIFHFHNALVYLNDILINITEFTLFTAHAVAHALMAGRTSLTTIAGTIIDFSADANFTIAKEGKHSHEPYEFLVMLTKVIVTLPLQLFLIPTGTITKKIINPKSEWSSCAKEAIQNSFYFVSEYIASKKQPSSCNHGNKNGDKSSHTPESSCTLQTNLYKKPGCHETSNNETHEAACSPNSHSPKRSCR